jgi:hypothetical protein
MSSSEGWGGVPAWRIRNLRIALIDAEQRGADPADSGTDLSHRALRRRFGRGRQALQMIARNFGLFRSLARRSAYGSPNDRAGFPPSCCTTSPTASCRIGKPVCCTTSPGAGASRPRFGMPLSTGHRGSSTRRRRHRGCAAPSRANSHGGSVGMRSCSEPGRSSPCSNSLRSDCRPAEPDGAHRPGFCAMRQHRLWRRGKKAAMTKATGMRLSADGQLRPASLFQQFCPLSGTLPIQWQTLQQGRCGHLRSATSSNRGKQGDSGCT